MEKRMPFKGKMLLLVIMVLLSNVVFGEWFFRGTANNWGSTQMTQVAGSTVLWETTQDFTGNTSPRFKIDRYANWATSYPTADYAVSTKKYKITFNSSTKAITATEITVVKTVTGVVVSGPTSVNKGSTIQLTAKITYSDGSTSTTDPVVWAGTANGVATIDTTGKVTGIAAGTAAFSATAGGKSGSLGITVTAVTDAWYFRGTANNWVATAMTQVTGTTKWEITQDFTGNTSPRFKIDHKGDWTEAYPTADYTVSTKKYKITFDSSTKAITATEVIVNKTITGVTVTGTNTVVKGSTVQLTAKVTYSDGSTSTTDNTVAWASSSIAAATVDNLGKVTGVAKGTATITATAGGKSGSVSVAVTEAVDAWYFRGTANNWVATAMTQIAGTTKWEITQDFTGNTSPRFKIDHKGDWTEAYPTADYVVLTKKYYITFDSSSKAVTATEIAGPAVSANPAGGTYSTMPVSVTMSVSVATQGKYTIDGTDPSNSSTAVTFTNGKVISIGAGLAEGGSVTLKLYAIENGVTSSNSYTFTKSTVVVNDDARNLRIYQVMVESFQDGSPNNDYNTGYGPSSHKGDLRGIINALPYIKGLGCNALWMTPIFKSDGSSALDATGYFCRDYFQVDPKFGTFDDAKELVKKAHDLGMYVFLDGVFGHHASGSVAASPTGKYPSGGSDPVTYPGSLDFYKEVATYWIDALEIDGWRLDQAYQVSTKNQSQNYWKDIREAVEAKCTARKNAGKTWGTLGYMVGEIWDGETNIQKWGYDAAGSAGLKSCFEFPVRYALVTVLATKEHTDEANYKGQPASVLNTSYNNSKSTYSSWAQPNLFLTNHDLVRFGDLIQRAGYGGKENTNYWKRHKAAYSFISAFSGPVTIYYGDEIGDEVAGVVGMNSGGYYDDNVARSNGQISGFDSKQQDLHDYVAKLMNVRNQYPALWRGDRTNLIGTSATVYADLKSDSTGKVVYVLNTSENATTVSLSQSSVGGSSLTDLISGTTITASGSTYSVPVEGITGRLLQVK